MSANKMKLYSDQYNKLTRNIFKEYVLSGETGLPVFTGVTNHV